MVNIKKKFLKNTKKKKKMVAWSNTVLIMQ